MPHPRVCFDAGGLWPSEPGMVSRVSDLEICHCGARTPSVTFQLTDRSDGLIWRCARVRARWSPKGVVAPRPGIGVVRRDAGELATPAPRRSRAHRSGAPLGRPRVSLRDIEVLRRQATVWVLSRTRSRLTLPIPQDKPGSASHDPDAMRVGARRIRSKPRHRSTMTCPTCPGEWRP